MNDETMEAANEMVREEDRIRVKSWFNEEDLLSPAMRMAVENFYTKVDNDLYRSERADHLRLCEDRAIKLFAVGEIGRAKNVARGFRRWDAKHREAYVAAFREHLHVRTRRRAVR